MYMTDFHSTSPGPCTTDLRSSSVIETPFVIIGGSFHENEKADRRDQDCN